MQIEFNPIGRRIRCIGHIINLSLQAFLQATSKEALNAALCAASQVAGTEMFSAFSTTLGVQDISEEAQFEASMQDCWEERGNKGKRKRTRDTSYCGWQGIPTLQKLHNIAIWLRSSSLHSDIWDRDVGLRLGIDNATRWSSWYKVLDNTMRKKPQITQFMTDYYTALGDNILTGMDWDLLSKTHTFLQPFASATLYAEGGSSSIAESLVLMDVLLNHYEKAKGSKIYDNLYTFTNRSLATILRS